MEKENVKKRPKTEIWVEKYRPKTFEEIEGDPLVLRRLKAMVEAGSIQHLMISGPPGTGKTTSVLAMARALFKGDPHVMAECCKELNASDDRGVDTVRNKIKEFAKKDVSGLLPPGRHKLVVLDEVDSMTEAAQQALRRIMEIYSNNTRFALICNHSTKVIEPIQSRCTIIRFGRLQEPMILRRILKICEFEQVDYNDEGLEMIVFSSEGDLRIAVNNLQSTSQGFTRVNRENVLKVCNAPPPERINTMIKYCFDGQWRNARNLALALIDEGYSTGDILSVAKTLIKRGNVTTRNGTPLDDEMLLQTLQVLTQATVNYSEGNTSFLHVERVLVDLVKLGGA